MNPDNADYRSLAALEARATPAPWQMQDGCSWRRIGTPSHDGNVLAPTVHNDGQPDLTSRDGKREANLALIVEARNALPGLLAELTRLRAVEAEAVALWHECSAASWELYPAIAAAARAQAQAGQEVQRG